MKKILFGLIATVLMFSANANANNTIDKRLTSVEILIKKKHFEGSITLSGGCHVSYSIDIEYTLIPPSVTSIHGTVTMTGNCSGTQSFRATAVTDEKGVIKSIETSLKGDALQSEEFKSAFIKQLNEFKIYED